MELNGKCESLVYVIDTNMVVKTYMEFDEDEILEDLNISISNGSKDLNEKLPFVHQILIGMGIYDLLDLKPEDISSNIDLANIVLDGIAAAVDNFYNQNRWKDDQTDTKN